MTKLIQHILTEDIFKAVFDDEVFHEENNIAKALKKIEQTFFSGEVKRKTLAASRPYYAQIKARATEMQDYTQKQEFLKGIYENFYKAYNPKAADTLGIVYTPKEIVNFMLESTDYLLEKHFGKTLSDKNVHILDPATGTGTFITDLLNYLPKQDLDYKYKNEIHANEVAILPYYIANLNIEYVYKNRMKDYVEFKNLCWVDTLDSTGGLQYAGKKGDLFGVTAENTLRIKNQNEQKISVIIGNPPYNAKQQNFNDQNANRTYKEIDKRIKDTFVKQGTAQNQIVLYDMYLRFYRWAMDRMDKNGIIAFITNRSFIDSKSFDGFRKIVQKEFNEIHIIDTKSDVRANPKISGTKNNVFGIQTGVAIMFLVKNEKKVGEKIKIFYHTLEDEQTKTEKLEWFKNTKLQDIDFELVKPDDKAVWINQTDNDFDSLIPLIDKEVKSGKKQEAIFELFTNGIQTNRDEWVYDLDIENQKRKSIYLVDTFNKSVKESKKDFSIKWSSSLDDYLKSKKDVSFDEKLISPTLYRLFFKKFHYKERIFNHRLTQNHLDFYGKYVNNENYQIILPGLASPKDFHSIATKYPVDLNFLPAGCQMLPLYRYVNGERVDNITDWALALFKDKYGSAVAASPADALDKELLAGSSTTAKVIEKTDIFHYVYAVLHKPEYRMKYEQNLKREFPRIPLYADFWKYAEAGKKLMELHLNYELEITNYKPLLQRKDIDLEVFKAEKAGKKKKITEVEMTSFSKDVISKTPFTVYPILKIKDNNIEIDELTTLCGVPAQALAYKLGNRSAIEWILDQYKPYKSDDKTIREHFNTYNFADYKEQVIELLQKITWVSVETMRIVGEL